MGIHTINSADTAAYKWDPAARDGYTRAPYYNNVRVTTCSLRVPRAQPSVVVAAFAIPHCDGERLSLRPFCTLPPSWGSRYSVFACFCFSSDMFRFCCGDDRARGRCVTPSPQHIYQLNKGVYLSTRGQNILFTGDPKGYRQCKYDPCKRLRTMQKPQYILFN